MIRIFAESQGLGVMATAAFECAGHIHLAHTASAASISGPTFDYLTRMLDSECRSTFGPYKKLLIACLSIVHLPSATATLSEFQSQGPPLRNFLSSKKCICRMKADNEVTIELL